MTLLASGITVPLTEIPDLVLPALRDTVIMVGLVMVIVLVVGVPLGALVHNLAPGGLLARPALHQPLTWVISIGRSLPFLILMIAIIPFTRLVVGTSIGWQAAVVPLTVGAIPFYARLVETSLREVPGGKVEAGERPEACLIRELREELGIETWSQYFLKFVMSHPAVTCCLSSTRATMSPCRCGSPGCLRTRRANAPRSR